MKSAEEYLQAECPVFEPLFADEATKVMGQDIVKAMKAYAQACCKEQREICAQAYEHESTFINQYNSVTKSVIKNAPEPNII